MRTYRVVTLMLVVVLVLSACNLPTARPTEQVNPNAVFTAAAQTVEVQLTQNAILNPTSSAPTVTLAAAATATLTPPSNTGSPTPPGIGLATLTPSIPQQTTNCDAAQFVTDVTIPDGTVFAAGATFTKTWRIKNVGTCTWNTSYALVFDSGDQMGGQKSQGLSGNVAPNQSVDISVNLQAPSDDGTYRGYWGLINSTGSRIPVAGGTNGRSFYVEIKVGNAATATLTQTAAKFAVTSIGFSVYRNGGCAAATGKYVINATIEVNKAGDVTYTWIRSDGATGPDLSGTLSFDSAGSKTISFEWFTTQSGLWVDLYIDNPNHQTFGRASLNCL